MIWPRYDETYLWLSTERSDTIEDVLSRRVDPNLREGLYDKAWKEIIEYEPRSDLRLVWIWSWNSYNDMLYIEPDSGAGAAPHGDLLIRKTAHYYEFFRQGTSFAWMEED